MKKWQLNINSLDGKRILTVSTDASVELKVTKWQMRQLILRTNAPMVLTNEKGGGVDFMNNMTQAAKLVFLKAANYD